MHNDEAVVISRPNDNDVALLSRRSYNSMLETLYLQSSKKNKERIERAMKDVEENLNLVGHQLIL